MNLSISMDFLVIITIICHRLAIRSDFPWCRSRWSSSKDTARTYWQSRPYDPPQTFELHGPSMYAFDGNITTNWWADCNPCPAGTHLWLHRKSWEIGRLCRNKFIWYSRTTWGAYLKKRTFQIITPRKIYDISWVPQNVDSRRPRRPGPLLFFQKVQVLQKNDMFNASRGCHAMWFRSVGEAMARLVLSTGPTGCQVHSDHTRQGSWLLILQRLGSLNSCWWHILLNHGLNLHVHAIYNRVCSIAK